MSHNTRTNYGQEILEQIATGVTAWNAVAPKHAELSRLHWRRSVVPFIATEQEASAAIRVDSDLDIDRIVERMGAGMQRLITEDVVITALYRQLEEKRLGTIIAKDVKRARITILEEGVMVTSMSGLRGDVPLDDPLYIASYRATEKPEPGTEIGSRVNFIGTAPILGGAVLLNTLAGRKFITGLVSAEAQPRVRIDVLTRRS